MAIQFFKKKRTNALKSSIDRADVIKVLDQTGKTNVLRDKTRDARLPGKRISKKGKVYWETRKNRSDKSAVTRL